MTPVFEELLKNLKQLPGLGYRSAEKIALHLLVEKPARLQRLVDSLQQAGSEIRRCASCGNLAEEEECPICIDESRDKKRISNFVAHVDFFQNSLKYS